MRNIKLPIQLLAWVTTIIIGVNACAELGDGNATITVSPMIIVTPLNEPGIVNADTVPVRRGPGVEFQQAATINHAYGIIVIGQSADGKWYQVEIPGYEGNQSSLWIAVDFVSILYPTETGTMAAVVYTASSAFTETITAVVLIPSQIATIQPSTSTCGAPTGWIIYIVQQGDNLFRLAQKTNTTVDQVMVANCLISNQISTGMQLYLPYLPPINTRIPVTPPTNTPTALATLPIQTPTFSATPTLIPIPTIADTPTTTPTLIPIPTIADTPTPIITQRAPGTP